MDNNNQKNKYTLKNIELNIAPNLLGKIGMIIILIGLVSLTRYSFSKWVTPHVKASLLIVTSLTLIYIGVNLHKKEKIILSNTITGGGVSLIYITSFMSYFNLNVINLQISMLICAIATTISILLSIKYHSRTISMLSIIGGFIPVFGYSFLTTEMLQGNFLYATIAYITILNISHIIISIKYDRWIVNKYTSLLLNILCTLEIAFRFENTIYSIIYSVFTLSLYLVITTLYIDTNTTSLIKDKIVNISNYVLMTLNTVLNYLVILLTILIVSNQNSEIRKFIVITHISYSIVHLIFGKIAKNKQSSIKIALYYTSLILLVTAIPLQYGMKLLPLSLFILSTVSVIIGKNKQKYYIEIAGLVSYALGAYSSILISYYYKMVNTPQNTMTQSYISLISIALSGIIIIYLNKKQLKSYTENSSNNNNNTNKKPLIGRTKTISSIISICVFMSLLILPLVIQKDITQNYLKTSSNHTIFIMYIVTILLQYTIILLVDKQNLIKTKILTILSNLTKALLILSTMAIQLDMTPHDRIKIRLLTSLLAIAINIFTIYNLKSIVQNLLVIKGKDKSEILLIISAIYSLIYSVVVANNFLITNETGIETTLVLMIISSIYIVIGINHEAHKLRIMGLVVIILMSIKLFIIDIANLSYYNDLLRIISYILLGITLIAISGLYQKLKKNKEL